MPQSVATPTVRTPANSLRSDLDAVRMKPAKARIGANSQASKEALALIRQAMSDKGVTQEILAINAGIPESVISEALNEKNGRQFSLGWLWAQDDTFLLYVIELAQKQRGFTTDGIRAVKVSRIVELIRLLLEVA